MQIEVDVVGQLFPNLFTMLYTLLVTGVLFFFVFKFLWNPAREMLAKREAYYDDKVSSADKMNEEATINLKEAKEAIVKADLLASEIKANAKSEAEAIKSDLVKEGQRQADDYVAKAKERMAKERKELEADINEQIVDVALAASEKLISSKDVKAQDKEAIERFIEELEDERSI